MSEIKHFYHLQKIILARVTQNPINATALLQMRSSIQLIRGQFIGLSGHSFKYELTNSRRFRPFSFRYVNYTLKILQPDFDKLEEKLQTPSVRKNINFPTHNILKQNFLVREKMKIATDNLILATEKLRDEIFKDAKEKFQLPGDKIE